MTASKPTTSTRDVWLVETNDRGQARWLRIGTAAVDGSGQIRLSVSVPTGVAVPKAAKSPRPNPDGSLTLSLTGATLNLRTPRQTHNVADAALPTPVAAQTEAVDTENATAKAAALSLSDKSSP